MATLKSVNAGFYATVYAPLHKTILYAQMNADAHSQSNAAHPLVLIVDFLAATTQTAAPQFSSVKTYALVRSAHTAPETQTADRSLEQSPLSSQLRSRRLACEHSHPTGTPTP